MREWRGSRRIRALAVTAFLLAFGTVTTVLSVYAAEDPIPGVDVVVERVPPGNAIGRFQTDRNGYVAFRSLAAGTYVVSDRYGNKASIDHRGGQATWRLVGSIKDGKPTWTLVDESKPL